MSVSGPTQRAHIRLVAAIIVLAILGFALPEAAARLFRILLLAAQGYRPDSIVDEPVLHAVKVALAKALVSEWWHALWLAAIWLPLGVFGVRLVMGKLPRWYRRIGGA